MKHMLSFALAALLTASTYPAAQASLGISLSEVEVALLSLGIRIPMEKDDDIAEYTQGTLYTGNAFLTLQLYGPLQDLEKLRLGFFYDQKYMNTSFAAVSAILYLADPSDPPIEWFTSAFESGEEASEIRIGGDKQLTLVNFAAGKKAELSFHIEGESH